VNSPIGPETGLDLPADHLQDRGLGATVEHVLEATRRCARAARRWCGTEPAAGEPRLAWAGLALHQARNSGMLLHRLPGTAGPTAEAEVEGAAQRHGREVGHRVVVAAAVDVRVDAERLAIRARLQDRGMPSGGMVRTPWMATRPPAPVRFSTTTLRP
jgi:hypothetical protein